MPRLNKYQRERLVRFVDRNINLDPEDEQALRDLHERHVAIVQAKERDALGLTVEGWDKLRVLGFLSEMTAIRTSDDYRDKVYLPVRVVLVDESRHSGGYRNRSHLAEAVATWTAEAKVYEDKLDAIRAPYLEAIRCATTDKVLLEAWPEAAIVIGRGHPPAQGIPAYVPPAIKADMERRRALLTDSSDEQE